MNRNIIALFKCQSYINIVVCARICIRSLSHVIIIIIIITVILVLIVAVSIGAADCLTTLDKGSAIRLG